MELYALDTVLDIKMVPPGPQDPNPNPQTIRTPVMQGMVGHLRRKAALRWTVSTATVEPRCGAMKAVQYIGII